jgi:hypothetical protein
MNVFSRVLGRLFLRLVRGAIQRRRRLAVFFGLVAGAIALSSFNLIPTAGSPTGRGPENVISYQGTENEPNATAGYIRGLQTADARLVWQAYSERAARDLQRRGVNFEETQRQLEQSQQNGNVIQGVQYVGAHLIPNGSMHFYVISRAGRSRGDVAYVPYVFTLNSQGKIERID